jgi:hypothetical protein
MAIFSRAGFSNKDLNSRNGSTAQSIVVDEGIVMAIPESFDKNLDDMKRAYLADRKARALRELPK